MPDRLAGKVAIITGAASGMGFAAARRFVAEGAAVVVADVNSDHGARAVQDIRNEWPNSRVVFQRTDVTMEDDLAELVDRAAAEFGSIDVMFNNAGIGGAFGPITDIRLEDWEYTYRVLVHGVFLGIKHAARHMIKQAGGGSIINTGSVAGIVGGNGPLCYSSAKAATNHLTRAAAVELAPRGIRVNNIIPGPIRTPLLTSGKRRGSDDELIRFVPLGRLGEPCDIAAAALFYASDESNFITGDSMVVDGGMLAASPGMVSRQTLDAGSQGPSGMNFGSTGLPTAVYPPKEREAGAGR